MASNSERLRKCYIHTNRDPVPEIFLHEHHKTPRAFGGADDDSNLIWLCVPCHDLLHRLATMKMSGKAGLVEDYLDSYLEYNITAKAKFLELIENVVKARLAFDEKTLEGDDTITLNLEIPRTLHKMLKTASMDYTKANGRPMGLYAFCVAALKRIASERLFGAASTTPHDQPSNSELFDARSPSKPALKRFG